MIDYIFLNNEDNIEEIRTMWKEIFHDTDEFMDFYFDEVSPNTKILVAKENDKIVGMLHLNPYSIKIEKVIKKAYYIIGVAVNEDYRNRGIMRKMIDYAFDQARDDDISLVFLMPENEAYYKSSGFIPVYETTVFQYKLKPVDKVELKNNNLDEKTKLLAVQKNNAVLECEKCDIDATKIDIEELSIDEENIRLMALSKISNHGLAIIANDINSNLNDFYNIYSVRDVKYLKQMISEHQCQNGDVYVAYSDDGIFSAIFSIDIYGTKCFVERLFVANNINVIFGLIKKIALARGCDKLYVTVENVRMKIDMLNYDAGLISMSKGKGIMAYITGDDDKLDMYILKNHCFFDEIV